jgi:thiol-disulfide isomerase/thioredoxin
MKKICLFILLLQGSLILYSQNVAHPAQPKPLSIGDTMPNIKIENILNYKSSKVHFEAFKDKLVIIDFWFGACPKCILAFPRLEELQKKFNDKIQVIVVNFESQEKIDETFKKFGRSSAIYRLPKLPSIVNDTIFHRLFPHRYYPHEVWIDGNGVIKAFTESDAVTEKNIQAALENRIVKMDMKIDDLSFNAEQPVFSQIYAGYPSHLKYYSVLLNDVPGITVGWTKQVVDQAASTVRVTRGNMTIIQLFTDALLGGEFDPYESGRFDFGKRVVLKIKDSSRYFFNETGGETWGEWKSKNCYIYEAVYPITAPETMNEVRIRDLENFFKLYCRLEKQKRKCWTLVRTSGRDRIKSKSDTALSIFEAVADTTKIRRQAITTKWLLEEISRANKNSPYFFYDDTGYDGRIDITLTKAALKDIAKLRQELRINYDLDLIEKEQEVEVLVFEEK